MMDENRLQTGKMERITRRWWFFLLFILLQFITPPYASKGYEWNQCGDVIMHSLRNAVVYSYPGVFPVFKIIPIVLIILIVIFRNRVSRLFSIYVAFSYMLFAFGQNIAVTEKYGLSICTVNLIMFPLVAGFWIWEAIIRQNDFSPAAKPIWRYWVVPLALLAFLAPGKPGDDLSGLGPAYLLTNGAGVAFCMMTPVYVGLLTLYWPKVNVATLRVTSLVGLIIGLYNMGTNFLISPGTRWWNGVLHIPLLCISFYGLVLSLKKQSRITRIDQMKERQEG